MKINISNTLISLADENYKAFSGALIPTTPIDKVLGVRMPELHKLAKTLSLDDFKLYKYNYHEEKLLHALVISNVRDFSSCIAEAERFLPHVDNWAVCDSFRPKCFKKHKNELLPHIMGWLESSHTYTLRFAIGMLMCHFLDEDFDEKYLHIVSRIKSDEYYVNMMMAWYFATALAKKYDATIKYFTAPTLDTWVHNKSIQKAVESYRISDETKDYLRTLKRK